MNRELFKQLVETPPELLPGLEEWDRQFLEGPQLRQIERLVRSFGPAPHVIEIGGGLSTLALLTLGATVTSFFSTEEKHIHVENMIAKYGLTRSAWTCVIRATDLMLARHIKRHPGLSCEIALIDHNYATQTVFMDFAYCYAALRPGGFILLNDCHNFFVKQLSKFLRIGAIAEEMGSVETMTTFRKPVGDNR